MATNRGSRPPLRARRTSTAGAETILSSTPTPAIAAPSRRRTPRSRRPDPPVRIFFFGAVRTVSGSMHVVEASGRRVVIDCGLHHGGRAESEERNRYFPFDPRGIDAIVLTHAHVDHSGNLPTLVRAGFDGPVYATPATRDLCRIMLHDSARIMEREAERHDRGPGRREATREPLYGEEDVEATMERFVGVDYRTRFGLGPGLTLELRDAGHVLGSSMVLFDVSRRSVGAVAAGRRRVCFTGDLGRPGRPLVADPRPVEDVDVLVMESTYGDRLHEPIEAMERVLAEVVNRTVARGGKVIVPAFALERAQTVVYLLHRLLHEGTIPRVPVYVDSPMTTDITGVFRRRPDDLDAETRAFHEHGDPFGFDALTYVSSVEQSKALRFDPDPCVIIAGSGMCHAGRIVHHLRNHLEDERCTVLIVGFQARHTLGRELVEHAPEVRIFGVDVPVFADVVRIDAFSSHADRDELAAFVEAFDPSPHDVFLVHGEEAQSLALARRLEGDGLPRVTVPRAGAFHDV